MGSGIPPTPVIGGVGLIEDVAKTATLAFKAAGEDICLIGGAPAWLGRSAWLMTVAGREEGAPPPVDLAAERRNGEFVASLIRAGKVSAVHDLSDGGLAVAMAEMAMAGGIGASVEADGPEHAFFFGEDQGRYVLTAPPDETAAIADEAKRLNVPFARIGITGGQTLKLGGAAPTALAALAEAYESWLPDTMSRPQGTDP
jgi:phosphoribosylformylglycinamidine synthase